MVVFPTEPVTPITLAPTIRSRAERPRRASAAAVSSTTTAGVPGGTRSAPRSSTSAAPAPASTAATTNSWPSRSARIATKSAPGGRSRESIATCSTTGPGAAPAPPTTVPPVAAAMSSNVHSTP